MSVNMKAILAWPGTWYLATAIAITMGIACGSYPPGGKIEEREGAFSVSACANASFDVFKGNLNPEFSVTSPATYNKCFRSYIVGVGTGGSGGSNAGHHNLIVEFGGPSPLDEPSCNDIVGAAIFYRQVLTGSGGGSGTTLSWVSMNGVASASAPIWDIENQSCHPPALRLTDFEQYGAARGFPLKVAATMRDGLNNTLPVRVRSARE